MSGQGPWSSELAAGARAQLPLLLGVTPFAVAYGAYAVESGISPGLAQAMSFIVFGGASQFVGVQQMVTEVPGIIIVLTTLLVNSRHSLYSAAIAPHVEHLSKRWRWLLAYLLTDEAYVTAAARYERPDSSLNKHWFFFGAAACLWLDWQLGSVAGVLLGRAVPESWSLGFALPLTFIAIVIPALKDRPSVAAALVAGVLATVGFRWGYGLNVLVPALCGLGAALLVSSWSHGPDTTEEPV